MKAVLVTGSSGLVGSETVSFFCEKGFTVIGIDNNFRKYFFGEEASTAWNTKKLKEKYQNFIHHNVDIRDNDKLCKIFSKYSKDIKLVVHSAAQPSHDWAAKEPITDFTVNANGTLNLLEHTRNFCSKATFIFMSTNKVYGDTPNLLPLEEKETRWEIDKKHPFYENGIGETMSIDNSTHSIFGCSKVAADILVQEYGRYFDMNTVVFRGGCLTGPAHSGTKLHGFLAYLMACVIDKQGYQIFGYKGKQVRDNIHSEDLVNAFYQFYLKPQKGKIYNMGGGRYSNCSVLEAITMCEKISGNRMSYEYVDKNRKGDHIWYISDVRNFQNDYPDWRYTKNIEDILLDIYTGLRKRK